MPHCARLLGIMFFNSERMAVRVVIWNRGETSVVAPRQVLSRRNFAGGERRNTGGRHGTSGIHSGQGSAEVGTFVSASARAGLRLTEVMFVSDARVLPVSFDDAAARLAGLAHGGWLRGLSENVYQGGVEYLLRVGPLGAVPGTSRLVRVRFAEPVLRPAMMTVGLRWEATGVTGGLFPALDADIRLIDEDDDGVRVTLTGSYRPPFGALGDELDRLLLRSVATATIKALLAQIAAALEGTAGQGGEEAALPWRPVPTPAA